MTIPTNFIFTDSTAWLNTSSDFSRYIKLLKLRNYIEEEIESKQWTWDHHLSSLLEQVDGLLKGMVNNGR